MKTKVKIETEIEILGIEISVPVRYGEQDIPNDFPKRQGDTWKAHVEMDTGRILGWPFGKEGYLSMKVCDEGTYTLLGENCKPLAVRKDYVPHGVVPGEYGDYIELRINTEGIITNWPAKPTVNAFFPDSESY